MSYQTYRFREITHTERRRVPCVQCGKKLTRQRTFVQTVNPFNKNADGEVKTPYEVRQDVLAEAREWEPKDVMCSPCFIANDPEVTQ